MRICVLLLLAAVLSFAQDGPTMPSRDEINELLAKAEQRVTGFEAVIKYLKPDFDKVDTAMFVNDTDRVKTARQLIDVLKKNGPSAYRLVSLLAALDDISVDAATGCVQLMILHANHGDLNQTFSGFSQPLMGSKADIKNISELFMHVTLSFIVNEEASLPPGIE